MPFFSWKTVIASKHKGNKNKKKTKQNKAKNNEGLGPSEVAFWATSPKQKNYTQHKKHKKKQIPPN